MQNKEFRTKGLLTYLLPGIILQSVLMGGGYATGREIVEYGGKFGALGWISGLATFATFAIIAIITFELARIYKAYDYKSIVKQTIGPFSIVYDVLYILLLFLIISVMASATGEILQQTIGVPTMVGVVAMVVVVGFLNFFGSSIIAKFETWGTIVLYAAYIIFTLMVIFSRGPEIANVFATGDTSFEPSASVGLALWTGIIYATYNISAIPAGLFTLRAQTRRREAVISGLIGALLMVIPWFLTYFALMAYYPNAEVIGGTVPWLTMLQNVSGSNVPVIVFGIVAGWTLIETATGMIHALTERIDAELGEYKREPLSRKARTLITVAILIAALLFAQIGIIDLISKGYAMISYGFMITYLLPLLTIGLYKVVKHGKKKS